MKFIRTAITAACLLAGVGSHAADDDDTRAMAIRAVAEKTGVDPASIKVIHIAAIDWRDSSLGCPSPGAMYTQAIVPGHLALLAVGTTRHRVHIGNGRAIVCDLKQIPLKMSETITAHFEQLATDDLAQRLRVDRGSIRVVSTDRVTWPDARLGCGDAGGTPSSGGEVSGFRIVLEQSGREYEYRTGRDRIAPCPDIQFE